MNEQFSKIETLKKKKEQLNARIQKLEALQKKHAKGSVIPDEKF